MRARDFIDSHKFITFFVILLLIAVYGRWENYTAWVYLGLHGTYGFLWVLKSRLFPDPNWERPVGLLLGICIWGALTFYWVAPWLITYQNIEAPPWLLGLGVMLYAFGVFLHFVSDMQKYITLQLRPKQLITDGVWKRLRNPNYFGELLIYCSFCLLAMHWLPPLLLAIMMGVVWIPNMLRKDRSLSRYGNFESYRKRSKWLIPFIF